MTNYGYAHSEQLWMDCANFLPTEDVNGHEVHLAREFMKSV
jgi:hypothetical protein